MSKSKKKKIDRLKTIEAKNSSIKLIFEKIGRKYEVLFKINKLNSTNLNPNFSPIIKQSARAEAKKLLEEGILMDKDFYKRYVARQSKKAVKILVNSMKKQKFEKFSKVSDNDYENLLPKN